MDKKLLRDLQAQQQLRPAKQAEVAAQASGAVAAKIGEERRAALKTALADAPPVVRQTVASIRPEVLVSKNAGDALRDALAGAQLTEAEREAAMAAVPPRQFERDDPALPAAVTPSVRSAIAAMQLGDVAAAAGLRPELAATLEQRLGGLHAATDDRLKDLIADKVLKQAEAARLGKLVSLYHLTGGDSKAAGALSEMKFESLGRPVAGVRDLLAVPAGELAGALRTAKVALPGGTTHQAFANDIQARLAERFPLEAMQRQNPPPSATVLAETLRAFAPLKAINADALVLDPGSLDLSALRGVQRGAAVGARASLAALVNRYPGLGLEQAFATANPALAARNAAARIGLIDAVIDSNLNVEILALDLSPGSEGLANLKTPGLSAADRDAVIGTFKAQQRVFAIAGDPLDTVQLMTAGYHSAVAIAREDSDSFAAKSGLAPNKALAIHAKASDSLAGVSIIVGSMLDAVKGGFERMGAGNLSSDIPDALRKIQGYADLFGPTDTCRCRHCQSILSPAAYFVDLMYFVEQHVTTKVFTGAKSGHALNLKTRRPDLWTLPLTCANTDTMLATLEIVNEILESYLAKRAQPGIDLGNRAAVRALVYEQTLASENRSFVTPFVLAHAQVEAYLQPFDETRAGLVAAAGLAEPRPSAAALGLAKPEYDLIVTPATGWPYLKALYQVQFAVTGGVVAPVDVQDMLRFTGLSRDELGTLVQTRTVTADGARNLLIKGQKRSPASVQNDVERLSGLDPAALDLMHRFTRLRRRLGWTNRELDLLLKQRTAAAAPAIDAAALVDLAEMQSIATRFALSVEEAAALWGEIPQTELVDGRRSLFDRRFNNRPYVLTEGLLPKDTQTFVHPSLRGGVPATTTDSMLQRLMLGVELSEEGLGDLIRLLAGQLGANMKAPNPDNRGFALSVANLSLLYRHARLARLLGRTTADLGGIITLAGIPGQAVTSLAGLRQLIDFDDWLRSSGYTLDDIAFAIGGTPLQPGKYPDPATIASAIVDEVTKQGELNFADTVFAFVPGVTETMSRSLVAANMALFEPAPQRLLRLKAGTSNAPALTLPPGVTAPLADLQAALARYHVSQVLPPRLAARLGLDPGKAAALAILAGLDLGTPALATALHGGYRPPLDAAADLLARLAVAFKAAGLGPNRIAFVGGQPALFGIANIAALTIADLRRLSLYRSLVAPMPEPADPAAAIDPDAVEDALTGFTAAQGFAAVPAARLGEAVGTTGSGATSLTGFAVLGTDAMEALARLASLARKTNDSGIGADAIKLIVSDVPLDLARGAEALVSLLRQRFPDDKDFEDRLEPLDNRLHGLKRDALADYVIRQSAGRFTSLDDLYAYFLIDVQFQGCARTSRVVAAISSVQTYVHRILLNLEQDRLDPDDVDQVHLLPTLIPEIEWSWRKNYRVWEANRKVFLWPENYIEPELRDDKTPLFKALEEGLLQQDVTEQNVLDAYAAYLMGFEEVASLKIAGATHDITADEDVLHVFGCTTADPPVYYYWTISNFYSSRHDPERRMTVSPRQKIDVAIPVRTVSPIVHLGRLHIFWSEISTASQNEVKNGESRFAGYKHSIKTRFTTLRLDGSWTSPQSIAMTATMDVSPGIVVSDPLKVRGNSTPNIPLHATELVEHREPRDDYTLTGFQWERVFPIKQGPTLLMNAGGLAALAETDLFDRDQKRVPSPVWTNLKSAWDFPRRLLHIGRNGAERSLFLPVVGHFGWYYAISPFARQALVADINSFEDYFIGWGVGTTGLPIYHNMVKLDALQRGPAVAFIRTPSVDAQAVGGAPDDAGLILQTDRDAVYVHRDGNGTRDVRLGTTLARQISRILFTGGVNQLLDTATQKLLREDPELLRTPFQVLLGLNNAPTPIDFSGAMGPYFREIFFQIPFLIADHLNGRGKHAAAQNWYHYVFDPTATLDADIDLSVLSGAQRTRALADRVWRYLKFRNLTPPTLRDILSDQASIEAYKRDPFNPHAIARLRISAYQKSVVMKYVTNLIDWGDSLFQQFTMESVNEALVLYVMALEILGRRPADVGECGEGGVSPRTYQQIRPTINAGSEFLLEVETGYWIAPRAESFARAAVMTQPGDRLIDFVRSTTEMNFIEGLQVATVLANSTPANTDDPLPAGALGGEAVLSRREAAREMATSFSDSPAIVAQMAAPSIAALGKSPVVRDQLNVAATEFIGIGVGGFSTRTATTAAAGPVGDPISRTTEWRKTRPVNWTEEKGQATATFGNDSLLIQDFSRAGRFGWSIVRQLGPVFCVPENKDLLALWDRVEDRLYKIRHCLDIAGARRDLALFAPEIDPRLLVRARAEGLSLEDVLGGLSGNLPPYRFVYLIEKAKQYAGSVQSFGALLLSAIEKRDLEELARLRHAQQADMLRITTRLREWELKMAEDALAQLQRQKEAVEFRRDYYSQLQDTDLLPWERTQQVMRHAATVSYTTSALLLGTAGILHLVPQLGSPFAMKYGGQELGSSSKNWGQMFGDTAKLLEVLGASAGLEASFERRREGWEHQEDLARHELKQIEKQISAASIRRDIAVRAIDLHKKSIEDQDEIIEFFSDKFSGLGLYKWMSATLQRLYRQTFNSALAMARLAERAYRFERGDDVTPLLQGGYWDAAKAGMLAGERLMADLVDLERRFIETNYRTLEIDQSFSLMQLAPAQLLKLRQTGECEFSIPEVALDLFYPGHYRRLVRAARLTIACVTGPYTNVAATLTLKRSFVRGAAKLGAAHLVEIPQRHTASVATSTAQNDAGVFDFSFRDERYMPFEGAGAVSVWAISLPKSFPPFDYQTINDVVISLSYSAAADGAFKAQVETQNAATQGTIANVLKTVPLPRAISLRQEHSSLFHRLLNSAPATPVVLEIDERTLPIFLRGAALTIGSARLLMRTGNGATGANAIIKINGQSVSSFAQDPAFPGYRTANIAAALSTGLLGPHNLSIQAAGDLAPTAPVPGDPAACDPTKLLDLVLYVELTT